MRPERDRREVVHICTMDLLMMARSSSASAGLTKTGKRKVSAGGRERTVPQSLHHDKHDFSSALDDGSPLWRYIQQLLLHDAVHCPSSQAGRSRRGKAMTSGQRVLRDHFRGVIEFDSSVTAEPIALQALTLVGKCEHSGQCQRHMLPSATNTKDKT